MPNEALPVVIDGDKTSCPHCKKLVIIPKLKDPALLHGFNEEVVLEALPKGTEERVLRHSRPKKVGPKESRPGPTVRRDADYSPKGTSKGRRAVKRSARREARLAKRTDFTEAVGFLNNAGDKTIDVLLQEAAGLRDPMAVLLVLEKVLDRADSPARMHELFEALNVWMDGRGM